jgi:hypothetical protein
MGCDTFASKTIFEIPGVVAQEHAVDALGDTGAKYNFMREEYAVQTGLSIQRDETRSVAITKNHNVTTTGTAEACFSFTGEEEQYSVIFHLLPDCLHDVILGNVFLKATKTLTSFASRIKKRVVENLSQYNLLFLGESAPRFTGYLFVIDRDMSYVKKSKSFTPFCRFYEYTAKMEIRLCGIRGCEAIPRRRTAYRGGRPHRGPAGR